MNSIRELLEEIQSSSNSDDSVKRHSFSGLSDGDIEAYGKKSLAVYKGKVRELIRKNDLLYIYHTDRLSAFDRYVGMVPYKGTILAKISEFWLKEAAKVLDTHFIQARHERVLEVEALEPIKAEVIVRGYMTGSMERAYLNGEREFCGVKLDEGLTPSCRLPSPIVTPTTKAEVFEHDENATPKELIEQGVCTEDEWNTINDMALKLFEYGQKLYLEKGWILVDTKYEFGRDSKGNIKIIDEVHTPDSSRLWVADSYEKLVSEGKKPEMLDKEIVRRYLMDQGFSGEGDVPNIPASELTSLAMVYLQVAESLIGKTLMSNGPEDSISFVVE